MHGAVFLRTNLALDNGSIRLTLWLNQDIETNDRVSSGRTKVVMTDESNLDDLGTNVRVAKGAAGVVDTKTMRSRRHGSEELSDRSQGFPWYDIQSLASASHSFNVRRLRYHFGQLHPRQVKKKLNDKSAIHNINHCPVHTVSIVCRPSGSRYSRIHIRTAG